MSTDTKLRIAIPTWANSTGAGFIGERPVTMYEFPSTSISLRLRAIDPADPGTYIGNEGRALSNLCLWFYVSADGGKRGFSVDVRMTDVHCAGLREAEHTLKAMRTIARKIPEQFKDEPIYLYLPRMLAAIGIKHSVQYHGIGATDKHLPVAAVLPAILAYIDTAYEACERVAARRAA